MFSDFFDVDNIIDIIDEYGVLDLSDEELKDYINRSIKNKTFVNVLHLISNLTLDEKIRILTLIENPYFFEKALYNEMPILSSVFFKLLPTNDMDRLRIVLKHIKGKAHEYFLSGKKASSLVYTYRQYILRMLFSLYTNGRMDDVNKFILEEHPSLISLYPLLLFMDEKDADEILRDYTKEDITELALHSIQEEEEDSASINRKYLPLDHPNIYIEDKFKKFLPYLITKGVDTEELISNLEQRKLKVVMEHYEKRLKEIEDHLYENYLAPRELATIVKEYMR